MVFTKREEEILSFVIEYFIKFRKPASSQLISRGTSLNISSATIRIILGKLEKLGYLHQLHISAGRLPTERGIRFYLDNLLKISPIPESKRNILRELYQNLVNKRGDKVFGATNFLSNCAKQASIGFISSQTEREIFIDGRVHLLDHFQFSTASEIRPFLNILENQDLLLPLVKSASEKSKTHVLFSSEFKGLDLPPCSLIAAPIHTKDGRSGALLVLGKLTMRYGDVMSLMEFTGNLVNEDSLSL